MAASKGGPSKRERKEGSADRALYENTQRATVLMSPESIAALWAALAAREPRTHAETVEMRAYGEALCWRSVDPEGHAAAALRDHASVPPESLGHFVRMLRARG